MAESWTHADGIVGHFRFSPDSKAGMTLDANGSQLVILEAKIFSGLSKGTKRAPDFDQAARNLACIADALHRSGRSLDQWTSLAFCLLAPRVQIQSGIFTHQLSRHSMAERIASRIAAYEADSRVRLDEWYAAWVLPLLKSIQIHCLDWESVIQKINEHDAHLGQGIQRFYDLTLNFNGRPGADSCGLASFTSSQSLKPPC